ncbi:hypothetical protein [uncultured Bradyrhizobium sp.]|uniref:hypothetical protein n=1 Tax=uncultured Bradyrhizobium sp. TaxID=199684 RepID=UPI0035CBD265
MSDHDDYEVAVKTFDVLSERTKKRLVRDSQGRWHNLEQSIYVLGYFDEMVGLACDEEREHFRPNFELSRAIMDEAADQAGRSGLPIDLCFQTVVLKWHFETIEAKVDAEMTKRKS